MLEVNDTESPDKAPASVSEALAPESVTCKAPVVELLALRVTVPLAAESKIVIAPFAVAVRAAASVLLTIAEPVPPLSIKDPVCRSPNALELTPVAPSSVIDVVADSPDTVERVTALPVDLRLMLAAVIPEAPESVIAPLPVIDTVPVPAAVACIAPP